MDKQTKDAWITALRSGEYKQGMQQLYDPNTNSYCCLGVFLAVIDYAREPNGTFLENKALLPMLVQENYGFSEMYKDYEGHITALSTVCMRMNDGLKFEQRKILTLVPKHTFNEIADWLEENLRTED